MTLDESKQVEDLLRTWYGWQRGQSFTFLRTHWYRPEDHTCREYDTPQSTEDQEEANEAWIEAAQSEQVQLCVDELTIQQRSAIQITMMIKEAGASVWRSERVGDDLERAVGLDDRHMAYQDAKHALWPMMLARHLVRRSPTTA